ncbi:hypothetical protein HMPREF0204_10542 [Chryseobacterium gleum ATCC 35910]|uniref:Transposase DDE domain-containing protein n=1 Tax=Chryseobacterium gleum ATCC 35910 TaxID=525257 RepID=A0ABN0AX81_CHRGE|nr:hypothetical protein HMPREF0204_10542 [Chryseobacterium gleum ATCC 35910]
MQKYFSGIKRMKQKLLFNRSEQYVKSMRANILTADSWIR